MSELFIIKNGHCEHGFNESCEICYWKAKSKSLERRVDLFMKYSYCDCDCSHLVALKVISPCRWCKTVIESNNLSFK